MKSIAYALWDSMIEIKCGPKENYRLSQIDSTVFSALAKYEHVHEKSAAYKINFVLHAFAIAATFSLRKHDNHRRGKVVSTSV